MAIALADLLDEKQVILRLRSRKPGERGAGNHSAAGREWERSTMQTNFSNKCSPARQVHPQRRRKMAFVFPHARTDLVDQIILGIGRSRAGIPFGKNGVRAPSDLRHRCAATIGQ